jgi:hypothetical protein
LARFASASIESGAGSAYEAAMTPVFDIADHDRLPWRFAARARSVNARRA